jgi:hypothetical protein
MELPETGTTSPGARRGRDLKMAGRTLAAYKKTPSEPAEAWCFSMRVASCFSLLCGAPGRREAKPRSFVSGIVAIGSRPSVPSRLLHVGDDTVCTGLSTLTTFAAGRFCASFRGCGDICLMASRSSGTEGSHIGQRRSRPGLLNVAGSSSSGCHLTPQTSIRSRRSGVTPSMGTWRTSLPTTFRTSTNTPFSPPWPGRKAKVGSFPRFSEQQD